MRGLLAAKLGFISRRFSAVLAALGSYQNLVNRAGTTGGRSQPHVIAEELAVPVEKDHVRSATMGGIDVGRHRIAIVLAKTGAIASAVRSRKSR